MKQMPHFRIQSSTFTHEFLIYSGTESIHVHHNGNNHFVTSSSIGKKVRVFDSLNTNPTEELYKQIIAIYSPDDATPEIFQQIMHQEQRGVTDCGLFAIAYAVELAYGCDPATIVYDQSSMRNRCGVFRKTSNLTISKI